jgi:hypothetical protein
MNSEETVGPPNVKDLLRSRRGGVRRGKARVGEGEKGEKRARRKYLGFRRRLSSRPLVSVLVVVVVGWVEVVEV